MDIDGVVAVSAGLGGFGAAPTGGPGYGAALGAFGCFGAPKSVSGNISSRLRSNRGLGGGVGTGCGVGVGQGNGGLPLRTSMAGLSHHVRIVNVVPSANRPRSAPVNASASVINPSIPVVPVAAHRLKQLKIHGKIG